MHHAVHLAAIRKQCSENPLKIMNAYRVHLKKPAPVFGTNTSKPVVGVAGGGGVNSTSGSGPAAEELLTKFDNLESLDDNKASDGQDDGNSSGWSSVFGGVTGGKASKFAVK